MGALLQALARVDLATAGWKTILGLAIVALSMFGAERGHVSKDMAELIALAGLSLAGVGLAGKAKRKLKPNTAKLPPPPAVPGGDLLPLLLAASMLLSGCVSAGDQFKASSIAYVAAVETAIELQAAGKLEPDEGAVISAAVAEGRLALNAWADALARGEDYPDGFEVVSSAIRRIAVYVRGKRG